MPRVYGINIPGLKPTYIALTYLYGIGRSTALEVCRILGIDPQRKANYLSELDIGRLNKHLDGELILEGELRQTVQQNINRLRKIRSFRGTRDRE